MRRLAVLPFALFTGAAFAQSVPEATNQDLWCGLAFIHLAETASTDAPQDKVDRFAEGGRQLADRAKAIFLETGYTEESLNAHIDTVRAEVGAQIDSAEIPDRYSYQDCDILLPF